MKTFVSLIILSLLATVANAEIQTREFNYSSGDTKLQGYLAWDDGVKGKRPGILVVHEWWGHNQHARERAEMLAGIGYTALAVDMYGDGKLANHPKQAGEFMNAAFKDWAGSKAKFEAAMKLLQRHDTVDENRIGAIGFCFGGAVSLRMARSGADLDGVVAFHSALPLEPAITQGSVKGSILVINGSEDSFLKPETVDAFNKQMEEGGVDFTYLNLMGVKHSFTNKQADEFSENFQLPNLEYNKEADERSWTEMKKFFQRIFK